jgi:FHA domain-containing protein
VDTCCGARENRRVLYRGGSRRRITRTLNAAYGAGLLSDDTFAARIDQALSSRLIDPVALIGDLNLRRPIPPWDRVRSRVHAWLRLARPNAPDDDRHLVLLALDWSGAQSELLIGRHLGCDIVVDEPSVSRHHARLVFRDDKWIVHDLKSTNGTRVNGTPVGRSELRPGDSLVLGNAHLQVD